jgi:hypothetical protein
MVRYREGVVDPDVAEAGEFGREIRIVLLLAGVEAGVLEAEDVATAHGLRGRLRLRADAILHERDRTLDDVRDLSGDRLE